MQNPGLKPVHENAAGEISIDRLRAVFLAFYENAGGSMQQLDAGGGLVDMLAAGPARSDETFFNILFVNP